MNKFDLTIGSIMEFSEPEDGSGLPLKVKGKSMHAGYIANKNVILPKSELDNVIKTLKEGVDGNGAYILKDHGYKGGLFSPKSVDLVVGRVTNAHKEGREAHYEGRIEDADMANKIRKKLVSASSVGMKFENMSCSICGRKYGDIQCTHILGREYPEEGLHESAKDYLDEMGGKAKAAIYATGLRVLEQSIVLFPAIEGSNIQETMSISFGEDMDEFVNEIESRKQGLLEETTNLDLDYDVIMIKLAKFTETFNNKLNIDISSEYKMDGDNFDFEKLTGELTDLKADKKLLEANVNTLTEKVSGLETKLEAKDDEIANLKSDINSKDDKISTLEEVVQNYKDDEKNRLEKERNDLVETLTEMRKDKELFEKDYSESTMEQLKTEFEILTEFKEDVDPKGSLNDGDDPEATEKKISEAKEDIREMIFRTRKDEKELKGIRKEDDLKIRLM